MAAEAKLSEALKAIRGGQLRFGPREFINVHSTTSNTISGYEQQIGALEAMDRCQKSSDAGFFNHAAAVDARNAVMACTAVDPSYGLAQELQIEVYGLAQELQIEVDEWLPKL